MTGGEAAVDERGSSPPLHSARRPLMSCAFPLGSADEVFLRVVLCHLHGHHLAMFFLLVEVLARCSLLSPWTSVGDEPSCRGVLACCPLLSPRTSVGDDPSCRGVLARCSLPSSRTSFDGVFSSDVPFCWMSSDEVFSPVVLCHLHGRHLVMFLLLVIC